MIHGNAKQGYPTNYNTNLHRSILLCRNGNFEMTTFRYYITLSTINHITLDSNVIPMKSIHYLQIIYFMKVPQLFGNRKNSQSLYSFDERDNGRVLTRSAFGQRPKQFCHMIKRNINKPHINFLQLSHGCKLWCHLIPCPNMNQIWKKLDWSNLEALKVATNGLIVRLLGDVVVFWGFYSPTTYWGFV